MIRAVVLLSLVGVSLPAEARPCRVVKQVAAAQTLVVTPFAVPVGLPVAPLGSVVYSYAGQSVCQCSHCQAPPRAAPPRPGSPPEPIDPSAVFGPASQREPAGAAVLRAKCAGCHSGDSAKGGVRLFDGEAWADGWRQHARGIFGQLRQGKMPQGGPPLTDEEFTAVAEFLIGE